MALNTYADLQTAVANWLHRVDLTSVIPDLITLGENRLLRDLRIREMESPLSGVISSGVLAVPADYIELKSAWVVTTPVVKLKRASLDKLYEMYPFRNSCGIPQHIARQGESFVFGPYPAGDYTVAGIYYARPDALSVEVNDVFLACPDAYLFSALCEAAPYLKDDQRIQLWESKYQSVIAQANSQSANEDASGGGMTVSAA